MKHCKAISRRPAVAQEGGGGVLSNLEIKVTFLVNLAQQIVNAIFQSSVNFR